MAKAKINPEFTYKTRDGQDVTELQVNDNGYNKSLYPFKAKVGGCFYCYTKQGYFHSSKYIEDMDLIKQPAKKTKQSREVEVSPGNSQAVPHKHHDLIVEWAKNPKLKMQFRQNSDEGNWYDNDSKDPHWYEQYDYRIKPEEPKFLTIIGADGKARSYPEPCKVKLEKDEQYFVPDVFSSELVTCVYSEDDTFDKIAFKFNLVHLTEKAAELHAKAMLGID